MDKNSILSVAIDAVRGVKTEYSDVQTSDELRKAFIELNGGSTKINPKTFRPGNELFDLVQELVPVAIEEGFKTANNPLFGLVEYRNIANGDLAEFDVEGDANFALATIANGIRDIRRQRIVGGAAIQVPTSMKSVRVYEELGRLLAGRIDFQKFVDGVAKAFVNYTAEAAFDALAGLTASTYNLDATYVKSGSLTAETLLELCEHVEAATGKAPMIVGSKAAVRKACGAEITASVERNADLYNNGYVGKFNGYTVAGLNQAHKPGTSEFLLPDDALWVIAADDKPVKVVNEGDGLMMLKEASENADLTNEYIYMQGIGVGVVCAAKMGYWSSISVG